MSFTFTLTKRVEAKQLAKLSICDLRKIEIFSGQTKSMLNPGRL